MSGQRNIQSSNSLPRRPIDANSKMLPLENPRQKFVAIHLGHQQQKIQCPVAQVRVLGFFETPEDLQRHYPNPDLDVYTIPVGAWFAVTKAPTPPEKAEELQQTVVDRVNAYIQQRKDEDKNLVDLSTKEKEGERYDKCKTSLQQMQGVDELVEQTSALESNVPAVKRNDEIRGQAYAVLSIIAEPDKDDEPLIQFFQAFDSRDDARDYMRNTLHQHKIPTNAFVVQMYEWVSPILTRSFQFKETVDTSFTHTELEQLHKGQKWEQEKIQSLIDSEKGKKRMEEISNMANEDAGVEESKEA